MPTKLYPKGAVLNFFSERNPRLSTCIKKLSSHNFLFLQSRISQVKPKITTAKECICFQRSRNDQEESDYLVQSTCLQSQSKTWLEHRKGRLTASRFVPFATLLLLSQLSHYSQANFEASSSSKRCGAGMGLKG